MPSLTFVQIKDTLQLATPRVSENLRPRPADAGGAAARVDQAEQPRALVFSHDGNLERLPGPG